MTLDTGTEFLLLWLFKEEFSSYGECQGDSLDKLLADGLVQLEPDSFGRADPGFQKVSLTELGLSTVASLS